MPLLRTNDPRPPYVQIADELRLAINTGQLKPGDRIDSGRNLAKRYGVAPMTIHNALNLLKSDGLLVSWQGRGVFVADPLPAGEEKSGADLTAEIRSLRTELAELRKRVRALEGRN